MDTKQRVVGVLTDLGVLQKGHFKLTSGRHSDSYMQCAKLFEHPVETAELCGYVAQHFSSQKIDTVVGPAIGGIIMAYEMARLLSARVIFAERENNVMALRRGFSVKQNETILVVEDVVTTGGSVKEVINLLTDNGANVIAVASIVDRSGGKVDFKKPFHSLLSMDIPSWDESECPLCKAGQALMKPGSRKA